MSTQLRLLAPGLLGPLPEGAVETLPRLPALGTFLVRAAATAAPPALPGLVAGQFQLPAGAEPPAGALGLLGEGGDPGDDYWFAVAPVHLHADRDRVLLFPLPEGSLSRAHADQLVAACNAHLRQDGLRLEAPRPERWYLRCPQPWEVRAAALEQVAGRYLDEHLPGGADVRRWNALATELQMLLHTAAANDERERQGLPTVNGLWLWGGGRLPVVGSGWDQVVGDEPLLRGLSRLAGLEPRIGTGSDAVLAAGGRALVLLDGPHRALGLGDYGEWLAALTSLDREWLAPALAALRQGRLGSLELQLPGRGFSLTRSGLARFWRRPRPLARYLEP